MLAYLYDLWTDLRLQITGKTWLKKNMYPLVDGKERIIVVTAYGYKHLTYNIFYLAIHICHDIYTFQVL